ncbi:helical backbone metal receptor [Taibaiella koreensis]|uniref:helical backbone metal receptor n=1 Tax=Taibaiella koreensis TaxID=1268548 RepID=UPI000E59E726|nr:helical backbone metal receptor [Taibaiella koreensis]
MYFLDPGHQLNQPPKRIVSLVPSQTELLYDLGLDAETVGITKFCVHPETWFRSKARVGGTKSLHRDRIAALQPDLIIANKEENVREQVEALGDIAPVWISDIHTLDDALQMIRTVGTLTSREENAEMIARCIEQDFAQLHAFAPSRNALYLIWRKPWMTVGRDTFIHDILQRAGLTNSYADQERYPAIDDEDIIARNPSLVLLSSEPYPFKEPHIQELQALLPAAHIQLVDGELFSWYGSRLLHTAAYLKQLQEHW